MGALTDHPEQPDLNLDMTQVAFFVVVELDGEVTLQGMAVRDEKYIVKTLRAIANDINQNGFRK